MAPPKRSKGKGTTHEGSSNQAPDTDVKFVYPLNTRRLLFAFRNRPLTQPKYGNLDSFQTRRIWLCVP